MKLLLIVMYSADYVSRSIEVIKTGLLHVVWIFVLIQPIQTPHHIYEISREVRAVKEERRTSSNP